MPNPSLVSRVLHRFGWVPATALRAAEERALQLDRIAKTYAAKASGVEISMGRFDYELNEKLRGSLKWDEYERMQYDPHIKGGLRFAMLPLLSAQWEIVSASDKPKDKEIRDFVEANYLCRSNDRFGRAYWCSTSWRQRLLEQLDMLPSGFSMFAHSTRPVGDKRVYDRISWLEPASVDPHGWKLDDKDNITAIERTFRTPLGGYELQSPLSPDQIGLYVYELKGARYEGTSFMRSSWGAYFRKDLLLKWSLIWAQKVGAGAPMAFYPRGFGDSEIDSLIAFVKQLRGESPTENYFVGPMSAEGVAPVVKYASGELGEQQVDRMGTLIQSQNMEMSHGLGTKTMQLGETEQGARALAEPISAIEVMALGAIATGLSETMNVGVANIEGEIPKLVNMNYRDVREYPRAECVRIFPERTLTHMPGIVAAVGAGLIPITPELRKQVTELYGFRLSEDAYEIEEFAERREREEESPGEDEERDQERDDESKDEKANGDRRALALEARHSRIEALLRPEQEGAPVKGAGFRRTKTRLEARYVNLAAVQESFRVGERDMMLALRDLHWRMLEQIMRRVRDGRVNARNLESQRRSKFSGTEKALKSLERELRQVAERGVEHAASEVTAQQEAGRAVA